MAAQERQKCPDDGTCHHECATRCFRVMHCGPLSGVYPDDAWPDDVRVAHGVPKRSRIEWSGNGLGGERGRFNGHDVFHLTYPSEWSKRFTLTSPLIFIGDRMGWLGTIEAADPGPEISYRVGERRSRAQIIADAEADKERWRTALDATKALAEVMLVDFAKSVLRILDEPNKVG